MFHKPLSSEGPGKKKSVDVPVRKSDRRKLRNVAVAFFELHETLVAPSLVDAVFLEDSLLVRKVLHKVQLYFRGPSLKDPDASLWPFRSTTECVWMSVDAGPGAPPIECPSVALLSLIPNFPAVIVPTQVSKYLCRGAHLMKAGIMSVPVSVMRPSSACDNVVAIQVHGNPQPFAVGLLNHAPGDKGVGVEVLLCYGDDVYRTTTINASSAKFQSPVNPVGGAPFDNGHWGNVGFLSGEIVRPIQNVQQDYDQSDDEKNYGLNQGDEEKFNEIQQGMEGKTPNHQSLNHIDDTADEAIIAVTAADSLQEQEQEINQEDLTKAQDELLHQATCNALVNIKDKDLPIPAATFYANYVLKLRPPGTTIQLKQSSFKKFGTYLLHQQQQGLLEVTPDKKDNNPAGFLKAIHRSHFDLRGVKKIAASETDKATTTKMGIVTLYIIPHHFVNLMRLDLDDVKAVHAKSEDRRGTGMLTAPESRAILEKYCQENELVSMDATQVTLDGPLTDALYKKSKGPVPTVVLSRKDVADVWLSKMESAHAIVQMPGSKVLKLARGEPPKIIVEVSMRSGEKFVTRVRGVEEYGINGTALCKDFTHRFACSGTVDADDPQMGNLKKGHVEIVFQGHWAEELKALLLGDDRLTSHGGAKGSDYCVPKQAIAVTLKKGVPGKKRK